jgi:hypothetical protein
MTDLAAKDRTRRAFLSTEKLSARNGVGRAGGLA